MEFSKVFFLFQLASDRQLGNTGHYFLSPKSQKNCFVTFVLEKKKFPMKEESRCAGNSGPVSDRKLHQLPFISSSKSNYWHTQWNEPFISLWK